MGRRLGPSTRIIGIEDRGGSGPGRYRVRYLLDGRKLAYGAATAGAAAAFVAKFEREHAGETGATVGETIDAWLDDRRAQGLAVHAYYGRWVRECLDAVLEAPVASATGSAMQDGYRACADRVAGATARLALTCLKMFGGYLVEQRVCRENPAAGIKPRGVAKKGKPQIETRREVVAFDAEALRRARGGDRAALGVLLGLHLGRRCGEVRRLESRHVDLDRVIRVPGTKSAAAARPAVVASDEVWTLVEQARDAGGRIVPHGDHRLIDVVREVAHAAGVTNADQLVFHSLRGMAASLATGGGAAFDAIAKALGHSSYTVTAQHYASPTSQAQAAGERRLAVLQGGRRA
jgi:integrase